MTSRFFVETPILESTAALVGTEAQHATRVLRLSVGDTVTLFDGSGSEFVGQVTRIERHRVAVRIEDRREIDREAGRPVTLGIALPKGERQRWLVEKATELGVAGLVPLQTARGVAQPRDGTLKKLQRAVIEASKQCGRNRLLQIEPPRSLLEFLERASPDKGSHRLLADPSGVPIGTLPLRDLRPLVAIIGPEGGLTDDEREAACRAGWQPVQLGRRILRIETAALALATLALLPEVD